MKGKRIFFVCLVFLALLAICSVPYLTDFDSDRTPAKVSGSPAAEDGAMIAQIDSARSEILVEAHSFTSVDMAKALVDARRRGVSIAVILDKDQQENRQYALARYLANSKITTYVEAQRATSGDSFMIVDGETVITGSFDSAPASRKPGTQSLMVAQSGELTKTYLASWNNHRTNSEAYNLQ